MKQRIIFFEIKKEFSESLFRFSLSLFYENQIIVVTLHIPIKGKNNN